MSNPSTTMPSKVFATNHVLVSHTFALVIGVFAACSIHLLRSWLLDELSLSQAWVHRFSLLLRRYWKEYYTEDVRKDKYCSDNGSGRERLQISSGRPGWGLWCIGRSCLNQATTTERWYARGDKFWAAVLEESSMMWYPKYSIALYGVWHNRKSCVD